MTTGLIIKTDQVYLLETRSCQQQQNINKLLTYGIVSKCKGQQYNQ